MQNHFSTFDLMPSFDLDLAALEKKYFTLQRLFHPDRLVGKSAQERQRAITQSMQVNEAYEALKSPLARARHLLALAGIEVGGERDTVKPQTALLMEIMESREALAEAEDAAALRALAQAHETQKKETLAALADAFAAGDPARAAELTMKLGYQMKFEDELRVKKKGIGA